MREVRFSEGAVEDLKRLDGEIRKRILDKIRYFATLQDPCATASPMINYRFGQWRRRIGDWRVIFDRDDTGKIIIILVVGHRSKVYR